MSLSPPPSTPVVEVRDGGLPLLRAEGVADCPGWAEEHRDALRRTVDEYGALLVRGLGLRDAAETSELFRRLAPLMEEHERFAPRERVSDGVYSATKWPPNQQMCMHHELSYLLQVPGLMLFACLRAPNERGATGVADATAVLDALPRDLVERFEREGWLLVRNYNEDIGATVEEAFGTADRPTVEEYCRANAIDFDWRTDGSLRTSQRRSAIVTHPRSGVRCWFNQIAFLNERTIDPEIREYLVEMFGEDGLPFTTRFGNGEPIGEEIVELINQTYDAHTLREPLQDGDLLLVDNVRMAHSREPFDGPREVLVGLGDPLHLRDCAPTIRVGTE
jgi:alpha-ketoglutarate-dependent taurine dioxygenase